MFDWLFNKDKGNDRSEESIQSAKVLQHLNEKYDIVFKIVKSDIYDNDGEKRINCTCTAQGLDGKTFEADANCSGSELDDWSDGFLCAKFEEQIKSYVDGMLDMFFPHYVSIVDNDNADPDNPDWSSGVDFDTFIRPYDDGADICATVITDMDRDSAAAVLPKLLGLIKEKNIRLELFINIVPPDKYDEEAEEMTSTRTSGICRSDLYYVFIDYDDEPEDLEITEKTE